MFTASSRGLVTVTSIWSMGNTPLSTPTTMRGKLVSGKTATGMVSARYTPTATSVRITKMMDLPCRERRAQEVIAEPLHLVEPVVPGTGRLVCLRELIHAPAERRRRVTLRQAELDVVAGVVESTGKVHAASAVRVQHGFVRRDERGRHVHPAGHRGRLRHQRHAAVTRLGVAAPAQWLVAIGPGGAGLLGVVEIQRLL